VTPVRWLLASAQEVPPDDGWLDPDALEQLRRNRLPARHNAFRLGRWTAKRAVAAWLGLEPDPLTLFRIAIPAAADGAPEALFDRRPVAAVLSLSHREGHAVCALAPAGTVLGCDLEKIEPRSAAFVRDYFTPAERARVDAAPEPDRPLLANLIWSAKESALKALRTGLRLDTREVEVELPVGDERSGWRPCAVRRAATGEIFHGWWRREGEFLLTVAAWPAPETPARLAA
jgi:4'-phosphopantetheinyl transferase